MENASKALVMAAGVLIGVLLISFMIYLFNDASVLTKSYDLRELEKLISKYNANFTTYQTSNADKFKVGANYEIDSSTEYRASVELNKISDVISAVNKAQSNNFTTSGGYRTHTEYVNSLAIVIDIKNSSILTNITNPKPKYIIIPDSEIKVGMLYGVDDAKCNTILNNWKTKINTNIETNCEEVEVSKFLELFRENTIKVNGDGKNYTSYKYYFIGETIQNEYTQKINQINFTLIENTNF